MSHPCEVFQIEDCNVFRYIKMMQCVARFILYTIFLWGSTRKPTTRRLDLYVLEDLKVDKKYCKFDKNMKEKIMSNPSCDEFDISLLHKSIQLACENVAPPYDSKWFIEDETQLEYLLTAVKNERNQLFHGHFVISDANLVRKTEVVRGLLTKCLEAAADRYGVDCAIVDNIIRDMNYDLNQIRDEPLGQQDIIQYNASQLKDFLVREGAEELRDVYRNRSYLNPVGFIVGVDLHLEVGEIFTRIEIANGGRCAKGEVIRYEDLLIQDQKQMPTSSNTVWRRSQAELILMEGVAGAGKTTLSKLFLSEWAEGKRNINGLLDFDLVLLMECRNPTIQSVSELISLLMPNTVTKFRKFQYLAIVQKCKVLFIIEGLDEINKASHELVKDVLNVFKGQVTTTILCTTRPEKVTFLYKIAPPEFHITHVRIVGIPDNKREEVARKYHEQLRSRGMSMQDTEGLVNFLRKTANRLRDHYRLPLNLVLLTWLWAMSPMRVNGVTTATELYKESHLLMIEKLLERLMYKIELATGYVKDLRPKIWEFLWKLYRESLLALSKNHMDILERSVDRLVAACNKHGLPSTEVLSAFLIQKRTWTAKGCLEQFYVPYKGIQDFFGASFILLAMFDKKKSANCSRTSPYDIFSFEKFDTDKFARLFWSKSSSLHHTLQSSELTRPAEVTICEVLHKLHRHDPSSFNIRAYHNVIVHLVGLLYQDDNLVDKEIAKELVRLLSISGITNEHQWFDIMALAKYNVVLTKYISRHLKNFLTGYISIDDTLVDCFIPLLRFSKPAGVIVNISSNPQHIPRFLTLLKELCHLTCPLDLHLKYDFLNPSIIGWEYDLALETIFQRCEVRTFFGTLSKATVAMLPASIEALHVSVGTSEQASHFFPSFSKSLCRLTELKELSVHINHNVSTRMISSLPWLRRVWLSLYLSGVTADHLSWVWKITKKLQRDPVGFHNAIVLPDTHLSASDCTRIIEGLHMEAIRMRDHFGHNDIELYRHAALTIVTPYVKSRHLPQLTRKAHELLHCHFNTNKWSHWNYCESSEW